MIRVERAETPADPDAVPSLLAGLDSRQGAWLGCDVSAEGLYRKESMGCIDPAVGFYLDGSELRVLAFTALGRALLAMIQPWAGFAPCEGGLVARFADGNPGPHPVLALLRKFLGSFSPAFPELALYGVFSFDYYRLAGTPGIPDDGKRRMVLYFADRVLVSRADGSRWIDFRFPGLETVGEGEPARLAPVRLERQADDLGPGGHATSVARGVERLRRGEVFSLVLSQTFRRRYSVAPSTAFNALRKLNPYPAMFCLNLGGGEHLFGASPDLQVRANDVHVESAPVCGTVQRGADPAGDVDQALALLNSDKEDASLAACADSDRNDKARVCQPGSVEVVSRRRVHFFSTIIHTIDHIRGRRRKGADAIDILLAHSRPATVTGLPKEAAIAAIEAIEATWRGWYAGAVTRLGSDGSMEALTVLRAARLVDHLAEVRTGGNLLVDSDPAREEDETRLKAETLFRVLAGESPTGTTSVKPAPSKFRISLLTSTDPMGDLLGDFLARLGCEVVEDGAQVRVVSAGLALPPDAAPWTPTLAIGAAAIIMMQSMGMRFTALAEPKYARRVQARGVAPEIIACPERMALAMYAAQVIEVKDIHKDWVACVVSVEGGVLVACERNRPLAAILCRPDSVQSMKSDAGGVIVRAALDRLAHWQAPRA